MTKEECVKIMAMLGAFYSGGKNDPKVQAQAWSLILAEYPYAIAEKAVLHFAKNDKREYATFPTVGAIVSEIEAEQMRINKPIKEVVRSISYGYEYTQLTDSAKTLISEGAYNEWLNMDAEAFSNRINILADTLRKGRLKLTD